MAKKMTLDDVGGALSALAIAKAIKDKLVKEARDEVAVGSFEVDTTVRIRGLLNVFEDEQYTPTAEIPIKAALALFIRYCGVTRDAARRALQQAMTEALNMNATGEEKTDVILERLGEDWRVVADCMTAVTQLAAALPQRTRKGKVTTELDIDVVA